MCVVRSGRGLAWSGSCGQGVLGCHRGPAGGRGGDPGGQAQPHQEVSLKVSRPFPSCLWSPWKRTAVLLQAQRVCVQGRVRRKGKDAGQPALEPGALVRCQQKRGGRRERWAGPPALQRLGVVPEWGGDGSWGSTSASWAPTLQGVPCERRQLQVRGRVRSVSAPGRKKEM